MFNRLAVFVFRAEAFAVARLAFAADFAIGLAALRAVVVFLEAAAFNFFLAGAFALFAESFVERGAEVIRPGR